MGGLELPSANAALSFFSESSDAVNDDDVSNSSGRRYRHLQDHRAGYGAAKRIPRLGSGNYPGGIKARRTVLRPCPCGCCKQRKACDNGSSFVSQNILTLSRLMAAPVWPPRFGPAQFRSQLLFLRAKTQSLSRATAAANRRNAGKAPHLPEQLQAKLDFPAVTCRSNLAKVGVAHRAVRICKLCVVPGVEELRPELQSPLFPE